MRMFLFTWEDARLFQGDGDFIVRVPNHYLAKHTFVLDVGLPIQKIYDHTEHIVYPVELEGKTYYIIAEEAGIEPILH